MYNSYSKTNQKKFVRREEVLELDRRDRVPLVDGIYQNLLANGSEGICGMPLGSHPSTQGKM